MPDRPILLPGHPPGGEQSLQTARRIGLPVLPAVEGPAAQPRCSQESVAVPLDRVAGAARIQGEIQVTTGPTTPADLLPLLRSLADAIVGSAAQAAQAQGQTISCKKGCGACCRQLVPLPPTEARRIRDLVKELPQPRRSEIEARFADARSRLQQAGLLEDLLDLGRVGKERRREFALEYFRQGIPCPFLEEESCSIHPDRPLVCREYLVTSFAEHCARPTAETVRCVPLPVRASNALARLDNDQPAEPERLVPLVLAPEWADTHAADGTGRPGPELLRDFFGHLS
jgi:Fe-S-cluster containining protein